MRYSGKFKESSMAKAKAIPDVGMPYRDLGQQARPNGRGPWCCAKVWKLHPTGNRSFKQMNTAIRLLPEWYMDRPRGVEDQGRSPVRKKKW